MQGQYKIYIIDEVHMMTKSAFNALLKTIEEPPKHIVFILRQPNLTKYYQLLFRVVRDLISAKYLPKILCNV